MGNGVFVAGYWDVGITGFHLRPDVRSNLIWTAWLDEGWMKLDGFGEASVGALFTCWC